MLRGLRIQNLRAFADSGTLPLSRINLITGANSSGKSTILDALLIALQTVESRDVRLPLVVNGAYANLGSYQDLVYGHDWQRDLTLEYSFQLPTSRRAQFAHFTDSDATLTSTFAYNRRSMQSYPTLTAYTSHPWRFVKERTNRNSSRLSVTNMSDDDTYGRTVDTATKFYVLSGVFLPFQRASRTAYDVMQLSYAVSWAFEQTFRNTYYLGPLRSRPERSYQAALETPQHVGITGAMAPVVIWQASRTVDERRRVMAKVNEWARKLGVAEEVGIRRIQGSYFSVILKDRASGIEASLADVGFGASQVLPLLVQAAYVREPSLFILEQPELHLHPAAQLGLGEVLAEIGAKHQLVIETHSEHIVRRMQTLAAEGQLKHEDVNIFYVTNRPNGATAELLTFDEKGYFSSLPSGFFDQGLSEAMRHVEAASGSGS